MSVPVVLIAFNRPETTAKVLAAIRGYRPSRLLVVADGPRPHRSGEAERCAAVRRLIDEGVDWPCDIERCWSDVNLGCRKRVSSGLDWAFSRADRAIVLEDDCLVHPSFFPYCEELLERYAHDERIGSIGACDVSESGADHDASYRFSRFHHVWGWASWSRAWRHYDVAAAAWPRLRDAGWLDGECHGRAERDFWRSVFEGVHTGRIDTWDFQWVFACWANRMLSICPQANLVTNIGFGADATHTTGADAAPSMATHGLRLPLRHPETLAIDHAADRITSAKHYRRSLRRRLFAALTGSA